MYAMESDREQPTTQDGARKNDNKLLRGNAGSTREEELVAEGTRQRNAPTVERTGRCEYVEPGHRDPEMEMLVALQTGARRELEKLRSLSQHLRLFLHWTHPAGAGGLDVEYFGYESARRLAWPMTPRGRRLTTSPLPP